MPRGATPPRRGRTQIAPTPDDIVGRMHKPIPEPTTKLYVARFTPVAGPNVLFRHEEHAKAVRHQVRDLPPPRQLRRPATRPAATTAPSTQQRLAPAQAGRTWRDTPRAVRLLP